MPSTNTTPRVKIRTRQFDGSWCKPERQRCWRDGCRQKATRVVGLTGHGYCEQHDPLRPLGLVAA